MSDSKRPSKDFDPELVEILASMSEGTVQALKDAKAFLNAGASPEEAAEKAVQTVSAEVNTGQKLREMLLK